MMETIEAGTKTLKIILSLNPFIPVISSIHFSVIQIPNPPKPFSSPVPNHLYCADFPLTILRLCTNKVSCMQHMSIIDLRFKISAICPDTPLSVPTFAQQTRTYKLTF